MVGSVAILVSGVYLALCVIPESCLGISRGVRGGR